MVKDAPNHILMNMIGSDQTSHKILEYGDVPILPVVLIIPKVLRYSAPLWDHINLRVEGG